MLVKNSLISFSYCIFAATVLNTAKNYKNTQILVELIFTLQID